jgi:hypothetical protein
MTHTYAPEVIKALARLRQYAEQYGGNPVGTPASAMARLLNTLDDAGVFATLDEQTDYASAVDILAESARDELDRHQGYAAASRLGKLERIPGTDTLRPAPGEGFTQDQACALFGDTLPEPETVSDEWAARARATRGNPHSPGCPSIKHRH